MFLEQGKYRRSGGAPRLGQVFNERGPENLNNAKHNHGKLLMCNMVSIQQDNLNSQQ